MAVQASLSILGDKPIHAKIARLTAYFYGSMYGRASTIIITFYFAFFHFVLNRIIIYWYRTILVNDEKKLSMCL